MQKLTVIAIAKNEETYIEIFLKKIQWADEIIIVDNDSTDHTIEIARKYTQKVFKNSENNLGLLKQFALSKATGDWVLVLDVDELLSDLLTLEIKQVLSNNQKCDAFAISYQNHFLGHPLTCKAQKYAKIRLFRKGKGTISPDAIHEETKIVGRVGQLREQILHYSFRSLPQVFKKFTHYAKTETPLLVAKGEQVTLKKLGLYPLHMFWAVFIKDEGWRDGVWGFGLAVCFSYYEFARYWFLLKNQI